MELKGERFKLFLGLVIMENKEKLRNMKRQMYSNLEGFLKDWEDYIQEEVERKHQVSMQCARDGAREEFAELIKKIDFHHMIGEKGNVCPEELIDRREIFNLL